MRALRLILGLVILCVTLFSSVWIAAAQGDKTAEATVVPDYLYIRKTPSTTGAILGDFPRGTVLIVTGVERNPNDSGTWVFVTPKGGSVTGWVRSDFLLFPADFVGLSTLPAVSTEGSATGVPATTTGATTTTTTGTVVTVQGGLAGATNQFANLRTGPELTFDLIRQLDPSTELTVVGRTTNGVWLAVVADGDAGWLFYTLVEVEGEVNSLPVLGATDPIAAVVTTTTTGGASVPPSNAPTSLSLKPNTPPNSGDGRLNASDDLGYDLIYCVDKNSYTNAESFAGGGIAVYRWNNASIAFFVSDAQIQAARANPAANGVVYSDGKYVLYAPDSTSFILTGHDILNQRNYSFGWKNCQPGARIN